MTPNCKTESEIVKRPSESRGNPSFVSRGIYPGETSGGAETLGQFVKQRPKRTQSHQRVSSADCKTPAGLELHLDELLRQFDRLPLQSPARGPLAQRIRQIEAAVEAASAV